MSLDRRGFVRSVAMIGAVVAMRPLDLLAMRAEPGSLRRVGPPRRVLVLGAGLAGLSAALELEAAGHDVTVLEARLHPGGRVRTLRGRFADGLHAEAGAGRIPNTHSLTLAYVARYGLPLIPFLPSGATVFFRKGTPVRNDAPDLLARMGLPPDEATLGIDRLLEGAVGPAMSRIGDLADPGWPDPILLSYDGMSASEFLRTAGLSAEAVQFIDLGLGLFDQLSAVELLIQLGNIAPPKLKIDGGMDRLPMAMAAELGPRVRYGREISAIRQTESGVLVEGQVAGELRRWSADRVICTLPYRVLRDIAIEPALDQAQGRAVRELSYDDVTRVYLQTSTRSWRERDLSGFAWTDYPMEIWDASDGQPGRRGLLMSYLRGQAALDMAGRDDDARIRNTATHVERVFPGVSESLEGGSSWAWSEEKYSLGAYAEWRPGELSRLYPFMAVPAGRIHFAGEHISPWPGWMQGALHSGLRAAREVNFA